MATGDPMCPGCGRYNCAAMWRGIPCGAVQPSQWVDKIFADPPLPSHAAEAKGPYRVERITADGFIVIGPSGPRPLIQSESDAIGTCATLNAVTQPNPFPAATAPPLAAFAPAAEAVNAAEAKVVPHVADILIALAPQPAVGGGVPDDIPLQHVPGRNPKDMVFVSKAKWDALHTELIRLASENTTMRKEYRRLISATATVRLVNAPEWIEYIVEELADACRTIGEPHAITYSKRDDIIKVVPVQQAALADQGQEARQ